MKIDILTLFPKMFRGPFDESIIKRAQEKGLVEINIHDLRQWATDKHATVDDKPYGGGVGMVMMVEPIYRTLLALLKWEVRNGNVDTEVGSEKNKSHVSLRSEATFHATERGKATPHSHIQPPTSKRIVLLDPGGTPFNQLKAQGLSKLEHLILIAGHYEGVDERVKEHLVDEEISIGDYVLTGGELPAMVIVDAIVRLIPGVLEKPEATKFESFSPITTLEYPQYTRPETFKGWKVPEVLLSGNHKEIERWKKEKALEKTKKLRPDLLH